MGVREVDGTHAGQAGDRRRSGGRGKDGPGMNETATVCVATKTGMRQTTAELIHGPFAVVRAAEGTWCVIHRATGRHVVVPGQRGYASRSDAEERIRRLLLAPVDWRAADWEAATEAYQAWKAATR